MLHPALVSSLSALFQAEISSNHCKESWRSEFLVFKGLMVETYKVESSWVCVLRENPACMYISRAVVLTWGVILPRKRHLAMFGDIFGVTVGLGSVQCYWYLVGRSQGYC